MQFILFSILDIFCLLFLVFCLLYAWGPKKISKQVIIIKTKKVLANLSLKLKLICVTNTRAQNRDVYL